MSAPETAAARATYDAFADSYDDFNNAYMYERWTGRLLDVAEAAGLEGRRMLDIACGTGLSFIAMLERGFTVTACDISPAMLEKARAKVGEAATLLEADMRELPDLGEFDLVWALNDSLNYLMSEEELVATLAGMRRNLAPGGIALFDVNTLTAYRTFFSEECVVEHGGRRFVWQGVASSEGVVPGAIYEARFGGEGEGVEEHVHRQRHFPEADVLAAIEAAGLRCVEVLGDDDGTQESGVDENRHTKAIYVMTADAA